MNQEIAIILIIIQMMAQQLFMESTKDLLCVVKSESKNKILYRFFIFIVCLLIHLACVYTLFRIIIS